MQSVIEDQRIRRRRKRGLEQPQMVQTFVVSKPQFALLRSFSGNPLYNPTNAGRSDRRGRWESGLRTFASWVGRFHPVADISFYAAILLGVLTMNYLFVAHGPVSRALHSPLFIDLPIGEDFDAVLYRYISSGEGQISPFAELELDPSQFQQMQIREHVVNSGDTISGIAEQYSLNMDTIVSFNKIDDARRLRSGDRYRIPDRDGLLHTVQYGESLAAVASRYNIPSNAILDANDLISERLEVGQPLFLPGARMDPVDLQIALGELMQFPYRGRFTSGFGYRRDPFTGLRRFHNGIDVAGPSGSAIRAAMAGVVAHVESQTGNYGRFIIIRHTNGFQTLYAHLSSFSVSLGQRVARGQQIGLLGNTGRSTGAHLHFSVIKNGRFVNPLAYLY